MGRAMRTLAFLLLLLLLLAAPARAGLSEADIAAVAAPPPPAGKRLPDLAFVDQDGLRLRWHDVTGDRPTVLLFADYTCRHLCGPGLTITAGALHDAGLVAGRDYRLVTIGLDPRDGPAAARAMRDAHLRMLPAEARAARLLVPDAAGLRAATRALGYRFAYDAQSDQFAHDAAAYVFRGDGGLSTVLSETGTPAPLMRAAIDAAARGTPGPGIVARAVTLCFGLGAVHGRYGAAIVAALRAGAIALMLLAAGLWLLGRRRRARPC